MSSDDAPEMTTSPVSGPPSTSWEAEVRASRARRSSAGAPPAASSGWAAKRAELLAARARGAARLSMGGEENARAESGGEEAVISPLASPPPLPLSLPTPADTDAVPHLTISFSAAEWRKAAADAEAAAAAAEASAQPRSLSPLRVAFERRAAARRAARSTSHGAGAVAAAVSPPPPRSTATALPAGRPPLPSIIHLRRHAVPAVAASLRRQSSCGEGGVEALKVLRRSPADIPGPSSRSRSVPPRASDPDTRTNFDKRAVRRILAQPLAQAIFRWRAASSSAQPLTPPAEPLPPGAAAAFVRKRPLFPAEQLRGEFDCVSVPADGSHAVVHAVGTKPDLKTMFVRHVRLSGPPSSFHCFGEEAGEAALCSAIAEPLVACVLAGGTATLLCFGQTGSGKTFSMGQIEARSLRVFFAGRGQGVSVQFYEIAGRRAFDLFRAGGGKCVDVAPTLRETPPSPYVVNAELMGATRLRPSSVEELLADLAVGKQRRATSATAANAQSSRSHALLRVSLEGGGCLTLADCAGSERREDSVRHDAAQRRSGAEINASLFALSECLRSRAKASQLGLPCGAPGAPRFPYRASLLTRLLAKGLAANEAGSRLALLATLSPASSDIEHSLSTLQTMSLLSDSLVFNETAEALNAGGGAASTPPPPPPPGPRRGLPLVQWRTADLRAWLQRKGFPRAAESAPAWMAGRDVARLSKAAVTAVLCLGDADAGERLYRALRDEIEGRHR